MTSEGGNYDHLRGCSGNIEITMLKAPGFTWPRYHGD